MNAYVACCGNCRHFAGTPVDLETQWRGLRVFGSGYSSVRSDDGICRLHERYLAASSLCGRHESEDVVAVGISEAKIGAVPINAATADA
jgi:hypothetical protein